MPLYKKSKELFLTKGNYRPASLFKGKTQIGGATDKTFSGKTVSITNSYNFRPSEIRIDGGNPSKNLFNIDKFIAAPNNSTYYSKTENNEVFQKKADFRQLNRVSPFIELPPGTYTMSLSGNTVLSWCIMVDGVRTEPPFTITNTATLALKSWYNTGSVVGKYQLEKGDTPTEYEDYIEPYEPTLIWNGEEIHIPYILREYDYICCNENKVEYFNFYTSTLEDITDTPLGQKLLSLETVYPSFNASISYGCLSVTAKVNN